MKKVGDLLRDMGFQKDSSPETQKAFIRYLIRIANRSHRPLLELDCEGPDQWQELRLSNQAQVNEALKSRQEPEQLSFNLSADKEEKKSG
ncbi:MAG: hypothetical protein ACK5Y2_01940 [Bdellovibrionales bacterium]